MEKDATNPQATAESRYQKMETARRPFLDRARQVSALTVPSIMPKAGFGTHSELPTPYQSLGARGLRNMASKLLLALFPQVPFFNYRMDDQTVEELGEERGEIEELLGKRERAVITEIEASAFRPVAYTVLTHLLAAGNIGLLIPEEPEDNAQTFRLDQFVVRRDRKGNLLEAIIYEEFDYASLEPEVQALISNTSEFDLTGLSDQPVKVFTWIMRKGKSFSVHQEVGGSSFLRAAPRTRKKNSRIAS
jgi:hypothetical protein